MSHQFLRRAPAALRGEDGVVQPAAVAAGEEVAVRRLGEQVLLVVGVAAAVGVGSVMFVTLMMPFVFPVAAGACALGWRRHRD